MKKLVLLFSRIKFLKQSLEQVIKKNNGIVSPIIFFKH